MDLGLKGKIAIVTGGASNIGKGIALTFAKEGSNVVIADIDESQGKKAAEQASSYGVRSIVIKADLTKLDETETVVKRTLDEFGKVDILVNDLGWADTIQYFWETEPDVWHKHIALNYLSALNCFKAVLPHMLERKSGSIVSVGSEAGRVGEFRQATYSGVKGALIAHSKAIAREVARHGIRVNVVCPASNMPPAEGDYGEHSMWNEWKQIWTPEAIEKSAQRYFPMRRLGTVPEVANVVVFIASEAASYVTGQTVSVAGGFSMI